MLDFFLVVPQGTVLFAFDINTLAFCQKLARGIHASSPTNAPPSEEVTLVTCVFSIIARFYSSFRIDGTSPKRIFRWGSI